MPEQNNQVSPRHAGHTEELISAIMLALATIASAWSAYQATRWSGVQATSFGEAATHRAESIRLTNIGSRKVGVDVGMFLQYASARSERNDTLAAFLLERFRPELRSATEEWLKTRPLQNPDAPGSPFEMPAYRIAELEQAEKRIDLAEKAFEKAKNANQTGDNYILLTVMFASVLFFAGVGSKFGSPYLRVSMLALGGLVFAVAGFILIEYPVY